MAIRNDIALYNVSNISSPNDIFNNLANAAGNSTRVIPNGRWASSCVRNDNVGISFTNAFHSGNNAANDFNAIIQGASGMNVGGLIKNTPLPNHWLSYHGLMQNNTWGGGWFNRNYQGNFIWTLPNQSTAIRNIQDQQIVSGKLGGNFIKPSAKLAGLFPLDNNFIFTGSSYGYNVGGWRNYPRITTTDWGGSSVVIGKGKFENSTRFFTLYNLNVKTNAADGFIDNFGYFNLEGNNNLFIIDILGTVNLIHNEAGDDKSIALIRCHEGTNNHFIINLIGKLNVNIDNGTGGSGFYFLVTRPKNNNRVTVINRHNLSTNIKYKFMYGDSTKSYQDYAGIGGDRVGTASITPGYDKF